MGVKEKTEYLEKITSLEENIKQIQIDKVEKYENKDMMLAAPLSVTNKKTKEENVCPICLYSYGQIKEEGLRLVSTQCGHIFCHKCMDELMEATNGETECPICNKRITRT